MNNIGEHMPVMRPAESGLRESLQAKEKALEFWRLLKRRKYTAFFVFFLCLGLSGLFLSQATPRYTSVALIMPDTKKAKVTNLQEVIQSGAADPVALLNDIEILKSRTAAIKVARKLSLNQVPEFNQPGRLSSLYQRLIGNGGQQLSDENVDERVLERLMASIDVSPKGRSLVIAISASSASPDLAAKIANAYADFHVVDQLEARFEATRRASQWLDERLGELRQSVETSERAVAAFRERSGLTEIRQATVVAQQLAELNTQLTLARAQTNEREARLRQVQDLVRTSTGTGSIGEVLASPTIQRLKDQETELARREAELNTRYGPNHPRMLNVKAEMADVARRLEEEVRRIVQGLSNEVSVARSKQSAIQTQLTQLERQTGELGRASVQLRQLERESEANRSIYETFLLRFKETQEQEELQQPDTRIVAEAVPSRTPSSPRYILILTIAAIFGLILGSALAIALERLDNGFRTSAQLEMLTGLPQLGSVPTAPGRSSLAHDYVVSKPTSSYSESLRSLYTGLLLGASEGSLGAVAVTSSIPGEGKSTLVLSLARMLSISGQKRRVIVVDLDLRRSSIAQKAKVKPSGTIDQFILGERTIDEIITKDSKTNLDLILSKSGTANPMELLESAKLRELIAALTRAYDIVLIDTPPTLAVADARMISKISDYTVFLVRWASTPREVALNALQLLLQSKIRLGVVLSQVNPDKQGLYSYSDYGYYGGRYKGYYVN